MKEAGVNSFCFVPLTTAVRRLGAMGFLSLEKEAYGETDLEFLQQVGKQVAVAVDNVLHHQDLTYDHDRLRLLLEVSEAIVSHRDLSSLFRDLAQRLPTVAPFDFIGLILHDPTKNVMKVHVLETAATHHLTTRLDGLELPIEESSSGWVWTHQQPLIIPSLAEEPRFTMGMAALKDIGVQSVCLFPLTTAMRRLGAIGSGVSNPTHLETKIWACSGSGETGGRGRGQRAQFRRHGSRAAVSGSRARSAQLGAGDQQRRRVAPRIARTPESDLRLPPSCDPARFRVVLSL